MEVTRNDIDLASRRIARHLRRTPTLTLGDVFDGGFTLSLKLEHLQATGSFKPRGAFSLLTSREIPDTGVTAASGGNFGIAVAHAAARLGHRAVIFVPETSPRSKLDRISVYGADVRVVPGYYDQAQAACAEHLETSGALMVHPYDQHEVVAGQGTVGKEITEDLADVSMILVAVGGGGLIGGIASWVRDDAAVVAVEPTRCPSMHAAIRGGGPVDAEVGGVAASSLGAARIGEHAWEATKWIDDTVLVEDEEIVAAQSWLFEVARIAVEPSAAVTIAALRTGAVRPGSGSHVVAVLSGANVQPWVL